MPHSILVDRKQLPQQLPIHTHQPDHKNLFLAREGPKQCYRDTHRKAKIEKYRQKDKETEAETHRQENRDTQTEAGRWENRHREIVDR